MTDRPLDRRRFLLGAAAGTSALMLAGCDQLVEDQGANDVVGSAQNLTRTVQRQVVGRRALAPEYTEADLSPQFRANGSTDPDDPDYKALAANGFADYRLVIDGLVERPANLSLADLRARPARTQITRHDCVEGWSCIGKWKGAPLGVLLDEIGVKPETRYIVFHCFDSLEPSLDGTGQYYESIDLIDAHHPQTILAYEMNDAALTVPHGAPLRLRVERQLGYKHAKYISRIEAVADFAHVSRGKGGFWEDRGYEWYAGI
jgi:DMSO/TMAO reductase YedYZ molybdopterin-dependent catalytic subunit